MNEDTIDFKLPPDMPEDGARECHMSRELFQNARMTMGEIRDFLRESGVSWEFIRHQIDEAEHSLSPVEKAIRRLDDYSTGLGRSLDDKPSNIW